MYMKKGGDVKQLKPAQDVIVLLYITFKISNATFFII